MIKTLLTTLALTTSIVCLAQKTSPVIYVKYKTAETYDWGSGIQSDYLQQWFADSFLIIKKQNRILKLKSINITENGVEIETSDTIKYKKEFDEINRAVARQMEEDIQHPLVIRKYNSRDIRTYIKRGERPSYNYFIPDTIPKLGEWQIYNDTMHVLAYRCQLGKIRYKDSEFKAWFAPELSCPAGPRNFRGLPGLILYVTDSTGNVLFEAVELKMPYVGKIPQPDPKAIEISQSEADRLSEIDNERNRRKAENLKKSN